MHTWIFLVVIAQFLNAFVAIIDKYIVTSKTVPRPFVYAFYVSILSSLGFAIYFFSWIELPFADIQIPSISGIEALTPNIFALSFVAAVGFFWGLVSLFNAFKVSDASDVVPVVASVSAITALGLNYYFFNTVLPDTFVLGFIFLIIGTLFISKYRFTVNTFSIALLAGILFGLQSVSLKALFNETTFDNGFFWSRLAVAFVAILILFVPQYRQRIFHQSKNTTAKGGLWVIGNKILGGAAGILVLKAIDLGDVSVIQALGGLQFIFLLIIAGLFGNKTPKDCGENVCRNDMIQKTISTAIITIGFIILFI